jgi:oxygen-independent coproporphyrinogen III oxidase
VQYLGLGPSAHSYQDAKRSWNVSNNAAYTRALAQGKLPTASTETLTRRDQLNEYLMTQLRIVEGLDLAHVKATWGVDLQYQEEEAIDQWLRQGWLHITGDQMQLTRQGFMVSDAIIRELFQVEDDEEEEQ